MIYARKSYIGVTWRAKLMAMAGKSAVEISTTLDIPLPAARYWVDECREHREAFNAAMET